LNLFISNSNPSPNLAQQRVLFTLILNRIDTIAVAFEIGAGGGSTAGVVVGYRTEAEKLQPQKRLIQHNMIRTYLMCVFNNCQLASLVYQKEWMGPAVMTFESQLPVQQNKDTKVGN